MKDLWQEVEGTKDKKVFYSNSTKPIKHLTLDLSNYSKMPISIRLFTNYFTVKVTDKIIHKESYLEKRWINYSDTLNGKIEVEVPEEGNNCIDSWYTDYTFNKDTFEELR